VQRKIPDMLQPSIHSGEFKQIPIDKIDLSPLNYRKYYSEIDMQEFAKELALHGIISPVTVRPGDNARYELVVGERRYRAAKIAKLKEIPACVCVLTDDEVIEIQLCENLQRENPHPMHEARAIEQMQKTKKSIDEIAGRLGKSKAFVFSRIKFLSLIKSFQEMFLADKISNAEALQIATLSQESQQEFFQQHCKEWKEKRFKLNNLSYNLSVYKYDLNDAPFNVKDKSLLPEAGACTGCPYNTATLKTLFPEDAKEAVCTNKECYHKKCNAHLLKELHEAFKEDTPQALIFNGAPSEVVKEALAQIPGALELPLYNRSDISMLSAPEEPSKEEYTYDEFDEDGYNQALEEYNSDMVEYNQMIHSGEVQNGLYISTNKIEYVPFALDKRNTQHVLRATAKDVQEAMKSGKVTPELLQAEINRLKEKEDRSKELDRDKVQLTIRDALSNTLQDGFEKCVITAEDHFAASLIIYQSLDYASRNEVDKVLFNDTEKHDNEKMHEFFAKLPDAQFAYLVRKALHHKSESQFPQSVTGYFLYKLAESARVNVKSIEEEQKEKAEVRQDRMEQRIKELERKIKGLKVIKDFQESPAS
jgi:ParB family chromosome partitioning protein